MAHLVFDIETCALPIEEFDSARREYLLRGCANDDERAERLRLMSLNPLTARIVTLGMLYVRSREVEPHTYVYSNVDVPSFEERFADGTIWRGMSESDLLKRWWDLLDARRHHHSLHLISFNGRAFDCPFLMLRSALLGIRPTRNLMDGTRWRWSDHTDVLEELSFHSNDRVGAMRRFNFDFYCKAFGITSSKSATIAGDKVAQFYREGLHRELAEYCLRDVRATWDLYEVWRRYLAGLGE